MCKYCKMPSGYSLKIAEWNEDFAIYKNIKGEYLMVCETEVNNKDISMANVVIKYCPYCGRKLGRD